ncbi:hypothetical protein JL721_10418 [Aureococcus anophagefferens]|nr:hypothetical protein JL721_10418 [Aureococcus anophagefferens]
MAGLLTIGDGLSGNIAEYYKKVAGKLGMSPKIKVFDDVQAQGGCNDDNGKGYPYLMNRVFIQHSLNLFFVGLTTPSYVSTSPLPYPGRTPGVARRGVRAPKDWGGRVLHQSEKCSQWTNVRAVWRR